MFDKTETAVLSVSGMHCNHCRGKVEQALSSLKGVKSVDVDLASATAHVTYVPAKTNVEAMVAAVNDAGFGAEVR